MDDGEPLPLVFDRLFVCRSGAWTPPWLDAAFVQFVDAASIPDCVNLDGISPRTFDAAAAQQLATHLRALTASHRGKAQAVDEAA